MGKQELPEGLRPEIDEDLFRVKENKRESEEEIKVFAETQTPKKEKPKEKTFGDMFDFNNMFRVKGKSGLVSVIHHAKGSQMAIVCDIYKKNRRSVSVDKMVRLGSQSFFKTDGSVIKMTEVFNNLMSYATTSEDYGFEKVSIEDLMPIMVPKYDKKQFKLYRAEEVLGWYIEVTLKYSALIDQKVEDGEVQLLTEEKED